MLAFFVGVTIDWGIPRLMPGDPIQSMLSKFSLQSASYTAQYNAFAKVFGTNLPLWQQYLNYWKGMFTGNLGLSVWAPPAHVARQLRAPAGLRLPGVPVSVPRAPGAVPVRHRLARVPPRPRVRPGAAAGLELDVHLFPAPA